MKRTIDLQQLENLYKIYNSNSEEPNDAAVNIDTLDAVINYLAGEDTNSPQAFKLKQRWQRELAEERSSH